MTPTNPHDLECALAAYGILLERAEKEGNRLEAKAMRKEINETIQAGEKLRSDLTDEQKLEAVRIGRIQFASAGARREK